MEPVLGSLHPPHLPQSFETCSGPASLAMATSAIQPNQDPWVDLEHQLWMEATGSDELPGAGPSRELFPEELALAALRQGFHARLKTQHPGTPWTEHLHDQGHDLDLVEEAYQAADRRARAAGLVVTGGEPTEADLRRATEAGHALVLLIDGSNRHDDRDPFPHWVAIVDLTDDVLLLHDPLKEGGPEDGLVSRLPAVQGFQGTYALLEIAPGNTLPT